MDHLIDEAKCRAAYDAASGYKDWESFRKGWRAAMQQLYREAYAETKELVTAETQSK